MTLFLGGVFHLSKTNEHCLELVKGIIHCICRYSIQTVYIKIEGIRTAGCNKGVEPLQPRYRAVDKAGEGKTLLVLTEAAAVMPQLALDYRDIIAGQ